MHSALFALFIGGTLAYGAAFAAYTLSHFDIVNIVRDVSYDDAFYYFQIAYHLSEGKFSTFDGGITRTNGYHPLWMFLITPFYWVFDKEAALFAIKAFEFMLLAGGVALIAIAARLARLPWILLLATLPMLYRIHALTAGMEAALALFMLALLFLALMLYARNPQRWKWLLAAVAFALPWVRLEYIAISLAATGALCLMEWSWRDESFGASWRDFARSVTALTALPSLLAAIAGILVYFAYNGIVFGGIIPVSAATKAAWAQIEWERDGGYSLFQNLQNTLRVYVFDYELLVALAVCACFLIVLWFARRSRSREDRLTLVFLIGVFSLAAGHIAKFAQTVLTVHPDLSVWRWYFVPAYLMMALIVPVGCCLAIYFIRRFIGARSIQAANILSIGIILAGLVFLLFNADFGRPFRHVEYRSGLTVGSAKWDVDLLAIYGGVKIMNSLLPENSVIGSWDAGITGYFSRFPVVNLDSLVNSYDYFHSTINDRRAYTGWQEPFIPIYQDFGITHFANLAHDNGYILHQGASLLTEGMQFNLWSAERPDEIVDAAFWFWERMEQHFDYRADGVGLIVDGRLVQAFSRDCAPDELLVLSWGGHGDELANSVWTKTQTGLCMATIVLPHNVLLPVRVETMSADDYLTGLVRDSQPAIRSDWDVYLIWWKAG